MRSLFILLVVILASVGMAVFFRPKAAKEGEADSSPKKDKKPKSDKAKALEDKVKEAAVEKAVAKKREREAAKAAGESKVTPLNQLHLGQDFAGRQKEVGEILSNIKKSKANLLNIHGPDGIGKTSIATRVIDKILHQFPDAQFYVNMRSDTGEPLPAIEAMSRVFHTLRPLDRFSDNLNYARNLYRAALGEMRVCIVLDNVVSESQIDPALAPRRIFLVVISDEPIPFSLKADFGVAEPDAEDYKEIVQLYAPLVLFWAPEFVKTCGGTPLAVTMVSKFLAVHHQLDPAKFLDEIRADKKKLEDKGMPPDQAGFEALLGQIYSRLPDGAGNVFARLGAFLGSFTPAAEAAICEDEKSEKLFQLANVGLVQENLDTNRCWLNDTVRKFAVSKLGGVEKNVTQKAFAKHYLSVIESIAEKFKAGNRAVKEEAMHQFNAEWKNIRLGYQWIAENMQKDPEAISLCDAYLTVGAPILQIRQEYKERCAWLRNGLHAARELGNKEHEKQHLIDLGREDYLQNYLDTALQSFNRALELCAAMGDVKAQAEILRWISKVHIADGKNPAALEALQKEQKLIQGLNEPSMECEVLLTMGEIQIKDKDFNSAQVSFNSALEIAKKSHNPTLLGLSLRYVGDLHLERKDAFTAHKYLEEALVIYQKLKNAREECETLKKLARALLDMQQTKKALEYLEKVLAFYRDAKDLFNEAETVSLIGTICQKSGDTRRSSELYVRAAELYSQVGKPRHSGDVYGKLAHIFREAGDLKKTIAVMERQINALRTANDRVGEGLALYEFSLALYDSGDKKQAIFEGEAALRLLQEANHSMTKAVRDKITGWRGA